MINKTSLVMAVALLAGCGGSDTDDSKLTLSLTDAPVAGVSEVNIFINSIELKKNSDTFNFEVNQSINLLDYQGSSSAALLVGVSVDAGQYQYIRLDLDLDKSTIVDTGGEHSFAMPSATGLKLNSGFILTANGHSNFTLDFDVAKSLTLTGTSNYKMRPTIRMIDNSLAGHINGEVASELLVECSDAKVYAFSGSNTSFDDLGSSAEPVTSAVVKDNNYEIGFLEEGDYSLYLLCAADDAETDDDISAVNQSSINVTVENKVKTQANISIVLQ